MYFPFRTVSRTPSISRTAVTKTNSSARSGQPTRQEKGDTGRKSSEKTPDKEAVGQVESEPATLERKTSDRNDRKVSNPPAKHGQGERKTSDKVEIAKKLSKIEKKIEKDPGTSSSSIVSRNVSTSRKVSSKENVVAKKESIVEERVSPKPNYNESHDDNQDRKVSKVATKNNDAIVKSDDDDNEDDIDNDSVEDSVPPVIRNIEIVNKDSTEIKSPRKQSFLNPFEPPCPELVNKNKLIEEFNTVQEQNMKNNIKTLDEPVVKESLTNIQPSNKTYFTSQALNNATSTTINQVSFCLSTLKSMRM